jgi:hypothetical protein
MYLRMLPMLLGVKACSNQVSVPAGHDCQSGKVPNLTSYIPAHAVHAFECQRVQQHHIHAKQYRSRCTAADAPVCLRVIVPCMLQHGHLHMLTAAVGRKTPRRGISTPSTGHLLLLTSLCKSGSSSSSNYQM